jgi:hypothetical protein
MVAMGMTVAWFTAGWVHILALNSDRPVMAKWVATTTEIPLGRRPTHHLTEHAGVTAMSTRVGLDALSA